VNTFPGLVHTARHIMGSRNKVALPEGGAGSPPLKDILFLVLRQVFGYVASLLLLKRNCYLESYEKVNVYYEFRFIIHG